MAQGSVKRLTNRRLRRAWGAVAIVLVAATLTFALDVYYSLTTEFGDLDILSSVLLAVFEEIPFVLLAIFVWQSRLSWVGAALSFLALVFLTAAAIDAAYTDESSTAALALLVAPVYGIGLVAVIYAGDALIAWVLRRRVGGHEARGS